MDVEIMRAAHDDAHAIAQIHVASWQAAYRDLMPADLLDNLSVKQRETYWRTAITNGTPELLVAKAQQAIVGWIAFAACRDADATSTDGEIWALYVEPAYWSEGIGYALWLAARERLRQQEFQTVRLWVLAENHRAIHFYERAGFVREPEQDQVIDIGRQALREVRYVAMLTPK